MSPQDESYIQNSSTSVRNTNHQIITITLTPRKQLQARGTKSQTPSPDTTQSTENATDLFYSMGPQGKLQ